MATMKLPQQQNNMKHQLKDILFAVSWTHIAKQYFGKSTSWLYHKLDGIDGNKKPTEFTPQEKEQLKQALHHLAQHITQTANNIK